MILYVTKETFERFKLKLPEEMSSPPIKALSQSVIDHRAFAKQPYLK
jgi:hypothetical protein